MFLPYGFRIYVVKAFTNRKKGREPEDVSVGTPAQQRIVELLSQLNAGGTQFLAPTAPEDADEPARPTASITVGQPLLVRDDLLHIEVATGEEGSHSTATRPAGTSLKLEGYSPEASHYVTFLFPRGSEGRFLIITEAIRRRDPVSRLIGRMTDQGLKDKKAAEERGQLERETAAQKGDPTPPVAASGRLLFDAHQAADNGYIDEILGAATSASATFTKKIPSDRGAKGEEVQRTLSIKLRDPESRSFVAVLGRQWFGRTREGNSTSQSQGVSELGDLLGAQNLLDDGEQATYDSAAVTVKGTGNQSTTIKVDTMRDVFTYPVSQGPPNARYYYGEVAGRVETVAAAEGLEVLRIEPEEVQECLEGSTSGP